MAPGEFEEVIKAISVSNLKEIVELTAALRIRLEALGAGSETISVGLERMLRRPDTWEEIEADFARHEAGERGFTLAEMRSFVRSSSDDSSPSAPTR
jgi:hypothetical protein